MIMPMPRTSIMAMTMIKCVQFLLLAHKEHDTNMIMTIMSMTITMITTIMSITMITTIMSITMITMII